LAAARDMERDLKEIIYDEFHRTGGHAGVRSQVLVDIREGPKYNVGIALFSQRPDDFDDSMRNLATTTLVFGVGEGDDVDRMQSLFKFSDAAIAAIKRMRKPDSDGSHVFGRFVTQFGTYEAKLRYTRGPTELWALSTTPADNAVMKMVAAALGATEARRRLALQYPGGTVENEVERRLRALMDRGIEADAGAASGQVLTQIAEGVIART
jgi:intracellular multiplication protein IcmB